MSFVPAYAAAVALFFVAERYRLPLLVPLCVGAGAAVDAAVRPSNLALAALGLGAAAVTLLAVAANWQLGLNDGRWLEGLRNAQQLVIPGRYDEADRWAAKLDARRPPNAGAGSYGVGAQLLVPESSGTRPSRISSRAHRADPLGPAATDYALGQAC